MRRPAYVTRYLRPGETASFENGAWYAVVRKSHREEGKKHPVTYTERIALITPEGRIELNAQKDIIPVSTFKCREFGFTYALSQLRSKCWINRMKEDASAIFREVIQLESPSSYLLEEKPPVLSKNRKLKMQVAVFWDYHDPDLRSNLQPLKELHLFSDNVKRYIECPSDTHLRIFETYGINIKETLLLDAVCQNKMRNEKR